MISRRCKFYEIFTVSDVTATCQVVREAAGDVAKNHFGTKHVQSTTSDLIEVAKQCKKASSIARSKGTKRVHPSMDKIWEDEFCVQEMDH